MRFRQSPSSSHDLAPVMLDVSRCYLFIELMTHATRKLLILNINGGREGFEPPIALRLCLISRRAYYLLLSII